MVRFTPNGLSVRSRRRAFSLVRSSGVGWVSAVIRPRAPALATAATSSARPTHCMPPWAIGCSTPKTSVNFVVMLIGLPGSHPDRPVQPDHLAVEHRVLHDVLRERAVLVGVAEAGRMRHLSTERALRLLGQR